MILKVWLIAEFGLGFIVTDQSITIRINVCERGTIFIIARLTLIVEAVAIGVIIVVASLTFTRWIAFLHAIGCNRKHHHEHANQ